MPERIEIKVDAIVNEKTSSDAPKNELRKSQEEQEKNIQEETRKEKDQQNLTQATNLTLDSAAASVGKVVPSYGKGTRLGFFMLAPAVRYLRARNQKIQTDIDYQKSLISQHQKDIRAAEQYLASDLVQRNPEMARKIKEGTDIRKMTMRQNIAANEEKMRRLEFWKSTKPGVVLKTLPWVAAALVALRKGHTEGQLAATRFGYQLFGTGGANVMGDVSQGISDFLAPASDIAANGIFGGAEASLDAWGDYGRRQDALAYMGSDNRSLERLWAENFPDSKFIKHQLSTFKTEMTRLQNRTTAEALQAAANRTSKR